MQRRIIAIGTAVAAATALVLTGCSGGGDASNSAPLKAHGPLPRAQSLLATSSVRSTRRLE